MTVLQARGLVKRYGGVTALDGVDIDLAAGEIHALVGENGAGKSTLVRILSGVTRPDAGTLSVDGRPTVFANPRDTMACGVATVAQELTVFPDLTVAENLLPHDPPRRAGLVSRRQAAARIRPVLAELGLAVPAGVRAGTLGLADQQLLEIGRALLQGPRVLILDEPTSALPADAVRRLAAVLQGLVRRGIAVLYISHVLEEVLRLAHRVSVLRDGRAVVTGAAAGSVTLDGLVTAMLGATAPPAAARPAPTATGAPDADAAPAVRVEGLSVPGELADVSFAVGAGEIVGLTGLQGAGHLTALAVLTGRARPASGQVDVAGRPAPRSIRQAVRAGIAFVPSDRKRYGLMLAAPVWQNTSAASWLGAGRGGWWLRRGRLARDAARHARRLRIRGGPYDVTGTLSGGNQQKVVVAKWLDTAPDVVILDDPTRGVDVGARAEMHAVIADLARAGTPVLLASTDLAELVELCDRVLVFQRGRLVADLPRADLSEQALSVAMNAGLAQ